jgi:ribosomal protein L10
MKLGNKNRAILLVNLHKLIEENAKSMVNAIFQKKINDLLTYPPGEGLTDSEQSELEKIPHNEILKNALQKVLAANTADVFFSFFNILDGTSDPEIDASQWTEVKLVDFQEKYQETEFLHDHFYASYWDWCKKKDN